MGFMAWLGLWTKGIQFCGKPAFAAVTAAGKLQSALLAGGDAPPGRLGLSYPMIRSHRLMVYLNSKFWQASSFENRVEDSMQHLARRIRFLQHCHLYRATPQFCDGRCIAWIEQHQHIADIEIMWRYRDDK